MKNNVVEIKSNNEFEDIVNNFDSLLVYFWTSSCQVCHDVFPRLLDIASKYDINIGRVNIEDVKLVSGQYLVFTAPTILVIKEGKEILRESRFIDFQNLERVLSLATK